MAPDCNIRCNYCQRENDQPYHTHRPGATKRLLSPLQAFYELKEDFSNGLNYIVSVAGPGEPLYNQETFEFFQIVHRAFPEAWLCTCTNGLLLPRKINQLVEAGTKSITVTVNALDPKILAKITPYIIMDGRKYCGAGGACILIENQIAGVREAIKNGIIIKINTVLIPDINQEECLNIARFFSKMGVQIMNIMGLIPGGGFAKMRPPSCYELRKVREDCQRYLAQFKRCMQCRADAGEFIRYVRRGSHSC